MLAEPTNRVHATVATPSHTSDKPRHRRHPFSWEARVREIKRALPPEYGPLVSEVLFGSPDR